MRFFWTTAVAILLQSSLPAVSSLVSDELDNQWDQLKRGEIISFTSNKEAPPSDGTAAIINSQQLLKVIEMQEEKLLSSISLKKLENLPQICNQMKTNLLSLDKLIRSFTNDKEQKKWSLLIESTLQQMEAVIGLNKGEDIEKLTLSNQLLSEHVSHLKEFLSNYHSDPQ
ncbi:MAG: hypothetical protein K0S07_730 [Chlamydiales bacterium]|jgi:hypothetical protein|nr:hypothetical protein [Chlamydiales bacterium]